MTPLPLEDVVRLRPLIAVATAGVLLTGAATAAASAGPRRPAFAPAATATVTPGVPIENPGGQCTANFVFTDRTGAVYLGQSAHCTGKGASTQTNGCSTPTLPLGTPVSVRGATRPGVLAYSSWVAMQRAGERDRNACAYNDFALVRLDPADVRRTNPSVPLFGGPVGLDTDGTSVGERVVSYGSSSLRLGLRATSPKRGVSLGDAFGGWSHTVYTATPGIPGDSGSGVLDAAGRAIGTLSTVGVLPFPASNGVSDLAHQLAYARAHGVPGLVLVPGTERFSATG